MPSFKFKLPKGTGYLHCLTGNTATISKDLYTVVEYDKSASVAEVLGKAKDQFCQQIAMKEVYNVKVWKSIHVDTDEIVWVGKVEKKK